MPANACYDSKEADVHTESQYTTCLPESSRRGETRARMGEGAAILTIRLRRRQYHSERLATVGQLL